MIKHFFFLLVPILTFTSCNKEGGINLFSVEQDIEFGEQLDSLIRANPSDYPIMDETKNPEAYKYVNDMLSHILSSDEILYGSEFDWDITIIDDNIKNAFAAPGGKLYFYTGLIDYLDNAAQFAGVLAHEVAHADRRHSTKRMTKEYGFSILLSILLGNEEDKALLTEIAENLAKGLVSKSFSREDEYEADEYSVKYLAEGNKYFAKGIAGFFEKLEDDGHSNDSKTFEFLSTHPTDDTRVDNINEVYNGLSDKGASSSSVFQGDYNGFKGLLGL